MSSYAHSNEGAPLGPDPLSKLTAREKEVVALIGEGFSNDEIAQRLYLSPGTVANHVAHILNKLGLKSRVQVAVALARNNHTRSSDEVLALLARLQEVETADLRGALQHASDVLVSFFGADKSDTFLYDPSEEMLVALGTSRTPLGKKQQELGLHRLPVSHGGRVAWVFQHGRPFLDGHVEDDAFELVGIRSDLGVRSTLAVPLVVSPDRRGVILVSSAFPERFGEPDLQLLEFVAYWVGLVARRTQTQHVPAR